MGVRHNFSVVRTGALVWSKRVGSERARKPGRMQRPPKSQPKRQPKHWKRPIKSLILKSRGHPVDAQGTDLNWLKLKKLHRITLLSPINGYLLFLELLHPTIVQKIHGKFTSNTKGALIMGPCMFGILQLLQDEIWT